MNYKLQPIGGDGQPQNGMPVEGQLCKLLVEKEKFEGKYHFIQDGVFSLTSTSENQIMVCWIDSAGQLWYQKCQKYRLVGGQLYIYCGGWYHWLTHNSLVLCNEATSMKLDALPQK